MRLRVLLTALLLAPLGSPATAQAALPTQARRFIAVLTPTATNCPKISPTRQPLGPEPKSFISSHLFPNAKTHRLQRYCVYTEVNGLVTAAPSHPDFVRIDPDLDVVLPQADMLADDTQVRRVLSAAYLASLGGTFGGTYAQPIYNTMTNLPKLAIVDTASERVTYAGAVTAKHGLAMAFLAEEVRCPGLQNNLLTAAKCRSLTRFYQAFPNQDDTQEPAVKPALAVKNSGLGSLGTVAGAIVRATTQSQTTTPVVVNLSLGWDHVEFAGQPYALTDPEHQQMIAAPNASIPAPVQAAHAALLYASCRGALIIAAAGNNVGGACNQTGPLEPAAWESLAAPSPTQCAAILAPTAPVSPPLPSPSSGRLVYAAGGIMDDGRPLPISRVGGTPPRVVPAFMAIPASKTDPWTGTSVSAAVLSGIAAAVWTYKPTWTAHEVIAWLDGISPHSGPKIDYPNPLASQKSARIAGAATRQALCQVTNTAPGCATPGTTGIVPNTDAAFAALLTTTQTTLPDSTRVMPVGVLPHQIQRTTTCGAAATVTYYGAAPPQTPPPLAWARPQPATPICPACPVKGTKLLLFPNPEHQSNFPSDNGNIKILKPTLEFQVNGSYPSLTLPDMTIEGPLEIDLSPYSMRVGKGTMTMATVLSLVKAGTLTILVKDATGTLVPAVSVVQVVP